jgi:hypothetical protein
VVNSKGGIYRWTGSGWIRYPGLATDVGVGANGSVWVVGVRAVPGGFGIFRWTGSTWAEVPGGAVNITIGPDGLPWVTNSAKQIWAG